jgi:sugar lactone lactonase YvrE
MISVYSDKANSLFRRAAMSRIGLVKLTLTAIVVTAGLAGARTYAQEGALPNPYHPVENFFKMPAGRSVGGTYGIEIDRDGSSIWVFERCGGTTCTGSNVAPILKFDSSGNVVKSFGANLIVTPHGLHIDRDGNIWVTDQSGEPGKGHQVFKLNQDGKVLMTLGTAGVTGEGPDTFNSPSDVLVAPNGDIFVGDGHGGNTNARIVKFSKDGKFIKAWGKKGTAPGEFETPHALVMDSRGRLFVADRGNNRIQIFDQDGKFLEEWKQFGRPAGLALDKNGILYVADHQSNEKVNPGFSKGIRIGSVSDGKVTEFIPDPDPNGTQEGVAADGNGNVYGTLTGGRALKKYTKKK